MGSDVVVVFGDLWGEYDRVAQRIVGEEAQGVVQRHDGLPLATVQIGRHEVTGALVMDESGRGGPVVVSCAGRIPIWLDDDDVSCAGWRTTDDVPRGLADPLCLVEIELWQFSDRANPQGWLKSVWLPVIPRPLQRLTITAGPGVGAAFEVRVLIVRRTDTVDELPKVLASTAEELPAGELEDHGWQEATDAGRYLPAYQELHDMSDAVRVHTTRRHDVAAVEEVELIDAAAVDRGTLDYLPKDVRRALRDALAASPSGSGGGDLADRADSDSSEPGVADRIVALDGRTFRFEARTDVPGAVLVDDDLLALQYLLLDADDVPLLAKYWDDAGIYILMDWPSTRWTGYAGQSLYLKTRLPRHRLKRPHLTRVLLIRRTTAGGFTSNEIAIMERFLAHDLFASRLARCENGKTPEGANAHRYEEDHCRAYLESVRSVLRMLGYMLYRETA